MDGSGALAIELFAADGVRLAGRYWPAPGARLGYAVVHGFTGSSQRREVEAICTRLAGRGAGVVRWTCGDTGPPTDAAAWGRSRTGTCPRRSSSCARRAT
jgi:hypothetical protein